MAGRTDGGEERQRANEPRVGPFRLQAVQHRLRGENLSSGPIPRVVPIGGLFASVVTLAAVMFLVALSLLPTEDLVPVSSLVRKGDDALGRGVVVLYVAERDCDAVRHGQTARVIFKEPKPLAVQGVVVSISTRGQQGERGLLFPVEVRFAPVRNHVLERDVTVEGWVTVRRQPTLLALFHRQGQ